MTILNGHPRDSYPEKVFQDPTEEEFEDMDPPASDEFVEEFMDDLEPHSPEVDTSSFFVNNETIIMYNCDGLMMHYVDVCSDGTESRSTSKVISARRRRRRKAIRHPPCLRKSCYKCRRPCPVSHKEERLSPECIQILTDMVAGLAAVWRAQNDHSNDQNSSADNPAQS